MVQIIQEQERPKKMSFMDRLGKAAGIAATEVPKFLMEQENQKAQAMKTQKENEVLSQLTGLSFDQLQDPTIRQKAFDFAMQGQQKEEQFGRESEFKEREASQRAKEAQELQEQKYREARRLERLKQKGRPTHEEKPKDLSSLRSGLKTLQEMKALRTKGNLGVGSTYSPWGQTRNDASKYSQLGKSLISLVSNIPIRNQKEFEVLAHDLYNPNLSDDAAAGILDAMEQIITQGLSEDESGKSQNLSSITGKSTPKEGGKRPIQEFFQ
jgi:hypothetical protein